MTEQLQNLKHFEGFKVPVYGTVEDPLFAGPDVQRLLGISKIHYHKQFIEGEDYIRSPGKNIYGHLRMINMFTEHGLYQVIFRTRSEVGDRFRKYVTTILRDIRLSKKIESERAYQSLREVLADLTSGETGTDLYIMQCRGNYKIGRSNNVDERLESLQTGNPEKIVLYKSWPGRGKFERIVHIKAETFLRRGIGEWFAPREADNVHMLVAWIDRLSEHMGHDE